MTISIKPTASGSTIEQDGSTVLSVESDRSVDIDSGTLYVDATNNNVGIGTSSPSNALEITTNLTDQLRISDITGDGYELRAGTNFIIKDDGIERMRITSGGEVYIAGTTDQGTYNLQCNGTGVWGAGAYVNGSDERIKENIVSLDSGLDVVAKLNPVTYTYKEEWSKDQSTQTGFIAQELLTALDGKNYVDGIVQQSGEYMSVAYQNIIPILTKAIQEQQDIIKALETRIQALESN